MERDMRPGDGAHVSGYSENGKLVGVTLGPANDVHTVGGYSYLCAGCFLVILDVSDPSDPTEVGRINR